jgi:hypothetical protein
LGFPTGWSFTTHKESSGAVTHAPAVVNGGNRITDQINRKSMPPSNYSNGWEIWVPKKVKSLPLPGLIPFMQFASFPAPDPNNWPDSSFLSWFKARGPVELVKVFSTFKELFSCSGSS